MLNCEESEGELLNFEESKGELSIVKMIRKIVRREKKPIEKKREENYSIVK